MLRLKVRPMASKYLPVQVYLQKGWKSQVAVCPQCGEISLYIEHVDQLKNRG